MLTLYNGKNYVFLYRVVNIVLEILISIVVLVTFFLEFLTLEDGTDRLVRIVGKEYPRRLQIAGEPVITNRIGCLH